MLRNDQVILRAVEPDDLEVMYLLENDARLWESADTSAPFSSYALRHYIETCSCNFYEDKTVRMAIALPTGLAVGFIDLHDYDPKHRRAEAGIALMREFQCQGLARQALDLLSVYARDVLHLHQIYAHVQDVNQRARRLFLASGFTHVATLPQWTLCADGWHDVLVFHQILGGVE